MIKASDRILMNSFGHTPLYILKDSMEKTVVTPKINVLRQQPVIDSLKSFYEHCGNLENNALNTSKPDLIKTENGQIGNKLKLVRVLNPKEDLKNISYVVNVSNIVMTPTITTSSMAIKRNLVPNINIVNQKKATKNHYNLLSPQGRILPKIKPKQNLSNSSKHESVQLLKLGETYHSLTNLSSHQMRVVTQALKQIDNSQKIPSEPIYDPVTNMRIVYKSAPPEDITNSKRDATIEKKEIRRNARKTEHKERIDEEQIFEEYKFNKTEPVITRSGRTIKTPKQILPEGILQKPKRKNGTVISCFQCSSDFNNVYQLQKHYESHPTHIPANIHTDLYHCLLAIIKNKPECERAKTFIQQLELIIQKIKSLLPCLLMDVDKSKGNCCTVNKHASWVLGLTPGEYNLNMDALTCVKDVDGYCRHNPPKKSDLKSVQKISDFCVCDEESIRSSNAVNDCARVNSVNEWPTVSKRIWKYKQQKSKIKKIKLCSENSDTHIDLGSENLSTVVDYDDLPINKENVDTTDKMQNQAEILYKDNWHNKDKSTNHDNISVIKDQKVEPKGSHIQFHSAHFDIRSSPIKHSQSTVFHKFQINPQKMAMYKVQISSINSGKHETDKTQYNNTQITTDIDNDLERILKDVEMPCEDISVLCNNHLIDNKNCVSFTKANGTHLEKEMKSNSITVDTNEMDVDNADSDNAKENLPIDANFVLSNHSQIVLNNFLESLENECLTFPETDIKNNSIDFNLDLFSFSNNC